MLSNMRLAILALAFLTVLAPVAGGCDPCLTKVSISGAWGCFPNPFTRACREEIAEAARRLADQAQQLRKQIEAAKDCLALPATCAQRELAKLIPGLDVTQCSTQQSKDRQSAGGYKVFYGPRVWDSKVHVLHTLVNCSSCIAKWVVAYLAKPDKIL